MTTEKKYRFPKAIGACADLLYKLREDRKAAQKKVDEMEAEEKALKEYIINTLPKSEAGGVAGKIARVAIVTKTIPQVSDWDAFWKQFKKGRDEDLLQRRLNNAAVEARWEEGKQVNGVDRFNVVTVSINKV